MTLARLSWDRRSPAPADWGRNRHLVGSRDYRAQPAKSTSGGDLRRNYRPTSGDPNFKCTAICHGKGPHPDAAIAHIKGETRRKANVVLLTETSCNTLAPRFQAMRDGFDALPGVSIIADMAPAPVTKASGYATMQKNCLRTTVDVVLGGDAVVLGALEALRRAGKARPDQFLGGIDGEPEGVAEIRRGTAPSRRASPFLPRLRLCHGSVCRRLAGREVDSPGNGHPPHRADARQHLLPTRLIWPIPEPFFCRAGTSRRVSQDVRELSAMTRATSISIFHGRPNTRYTALTPESFTRRSQSDVNSRHAAPLREPDDV